MKRNRLLFLFAYLILFTFAFAASASAASYVFQAPSGVTTYLDRQGNSWAVDTNGMVTVTDSASIQAATLIRSFLDAGFVLLNITTPTASHNYGAATTGSGLIWTLAANEIPAEVLYVTNAGAASSIVSTPTIGRRYLVVNASGQTVTILASGQSGVAVANSAQIPVVGNGTDFVSVATTTSSISGATINNSIIGGTTPVAGTFTTFGYLGFATASHDYGGVHADWTLSAAEGKARSFTTTNAAGAGANAILPSGFVGVFYVSNTSGQTITWKYSASTGVANANSKKAILVADGAEVYSVKADY